MKFSVNQTALDQARKLLQGYDRLYWIVGGACSGKSTISQALAKSYPVTVYDMDAYIYGAYMPRYTAEAHPANKTWLSAPNPLEWQLGLSLSEFDDFNRATTVEYVQLLAEDMQGKSPQQSIIVDGGITHPSVLVQVIPPAQIIGLNTTRENRVHLWETAEDRQQMKDWIMSLPDPQQKWQKFLQCDEQINQTIVTDCQQAGIVVFQRDEQTTVESLTQKIALQLGLARSTNDAE